MPVRALKLVVCVGLAAAALVPPAEATSPAGQNGRIYFTTSRAGPFSIWSVASTGGLATQAVGVPPGLAALTPSVSPDGRRVVFQRNLGGGNLDIAVANADGTGEVNLTSTPAISEQDAVFSPDGRRIAFERASGPDFDIWIMNADGTGQVDVTATPSSQEVFPEWSPDGSKLVFGRGSDLILKDLASGSEFNLTATRPEAYQSPSFSTDGLRIAATRFDANANIAVLNIDGSSAPDVAATALNETDPVYSPDGTKVAYRLDTNDIVVAPATGGTPVNLTPGTPSAESEPVWESIYTCAGRRATIVGSDAPETLRGTKRADVITGNAGNDRILGLKGKDRLCGGAGKDRLIGGKGKDKLVGGPGKDKQRQ